MYEACVKQNTSLSALSFWGTNAIFKAVSGNKEEISLSASVRSLS